jgi:ribose 5-phosphate isomerase A
VSREAAKRAAARKSCEWVADGMALGLGTGSTAFHVVERVAELVRDGMRLTAVATSRATAEQARGCGIELRELDEVESLDLCIDGADEVDPAGHLIKGGGGALTREKMVALAARELIIVADAGKRVERLGLAFRLPLEILSFGVAHTLRRLERFGEPTLRLQSSGAPYVTDNGGCICDLRLPDGVAAADVAALDRTLRLVPGVVECGLFPDMARRVILGHDDGSVSVTEVS